MMAENCGSCRFWLRRYGNDRGTYAGLCRVRSPRFSDRTIPGRDGFEAIWPTTHKDAWCGEFQPASKSGETA